MSLRAFSGMFSTVSNAVHVLKLPISCQSLSTVRMNLLHGSVFNVRSFHCGGAPLNFQFTPILNAEPMKKRKRVDPALLREKMEKRIKRFQREIRRLEKVAKKFKPLMELEVPKKIIKESQRLRPPPVLSEEEIQRRWDIEKNWRIYKYEQHHRELRMINKLIASQEKAMDELQEASPELYEEALQVDLTIIPFQMTGPVRTPPIEEFNHPEGDFIDITKVYKPIIPIEEKKKKGRVNASKKRNL